MSVSVALGLLLALLTAFGSVAGFLFKFRGARNVAPVELRRPVRSTILLFRSPVYSLGIAIGLSSLLAHVGALALAPISLAQATVAGGLVLLTVAANQLFGIEVTRREWIGVTLMGAGLAALAATLSGDARNAHSHYAVGTLTVFLLATAGSGLLLTALFSRRASALAVAAGLEWAASDISIKALSAHLHALGAGVLLQPLALVIFLASMVGLLISARSLQLGDAVPMILLTSAAALPRSPPPPRKCRDSGDGETGNSEIVVCGTDNAGQRIPSTSESDPTSRAGLRNGELHAPQLDKGSCRGKFGCLIWPVDCGL